jgi:hypothetical protein
MALSVGPRSRKITVLPDESGHRRFENLPGMGPARPTRNGNSKSFPEHRPIIESVDWTFSLSPQISPWPPQSMHPGAFSLHVSVFFSRLALASPMGRRSLVILVYLMFISFLVGRFPPHFHHLNLDFANCNFLSSFQM